MIIPPKYLNLYCRVGTDFDYSVSIKDLTNAVIDLTNYTITSSFSNSSLPIDSINSTMVKSYLLTVTKTDAVNGLITLSLTDTESDTIPIGRYFLQVNGTDSSSKIHRLIEGIFTITY